MSKSAMLGGAISALITYWVLSPFETDLDKLAHYCVGFLFGWLAACLVIYLEGLDKK